MKRPSLILLPALAAVLALTGCFQNLLFYRQYMVGSSGTDWAINEVEVNYLGTCGPDAITVENDHGVRARLPFDSAHFPRGAEVDKLNLSERDVVELRDAAERQLRDHLGAVKRLKLVTFKRVKEGEITENLLIDTLSDSQGNSLAETMLMRGFWICDRETVELARAKRLFKPEAEARRQLAGIWRRQAVFNPNFGWPDTK